MSAPSHVPLHLVLCRLGSEDVEWAVRATVATSAKRMQLVIYNAGPPIKMSEWPPEATESIIVRKLQVTGGHESFCYLEHIQRSLRGGNGFAQKLDSGARPTLHAPGPHECGRCDMQKRRMRSTSKPSASKESELLYLVTSIRIRCRSSYK